MDQVAPSFITAAGILIVLIVWRWLWIRGERRKLVSTESAFEKARFDPEVSRDEDDKTYAGRVITRLRAHVVDGRIEINWRFHPDYIHRGFVLTAKERRHGGSWEPLPFEPHQDSGSWEDSFRYGDIATYLFVVKKTYHFFFGLIPGDDIEIVYDQISFSVRKGQFLKERKELIRDRKELLAEVKEYAALETELRRMAAKAGQHEGSNPQIDAKVAKLEKHLAKRRAFDEVVEKKEAEIRAHPSWSDERKNEEIEKLRDMAEQIALED